MHTRVQKWGNSLALRIPKPYAQALGIELDSAVTLRLEGTRLIIEPASREHLDELLAQVTPDNLHGEIDMGDATGNEVW